MPHTNVRWNTMTRLQDLYKQLIIQRRREIDDWLAEYKEFTGEVAKVQMALKSGLHMREPKTYIGTSFERKPDQFEAFAERLIFKRENGIASCGQGGLARANFDQFIADNAFVGALESLIREPSRETLRTFRERWQSFGKGHRPLLINRVLAACTTAVSIAVDNKRFEKVYGWLIREGIIVVPESPAEDWYAMNLHLVSQLRERLRDDQMSETKDEHLVNIFVWRLFNYINNPILMKNQIIETLVTLLEFNKQVVLTGAPGTGKTFLARQLAAKLLNCSDEDLTKEDEFKKRFGFVQFHPAYDYTDFVEGLKPVIDYKGDKGQIEFEVRDGVFMKFCKEAEKQEAGRKCVFVIDEINRADLSRVFGELFYALEPGYRGKEGAVSTQYALGRKESDRQDFYVPDNVYIIGTMNDIDRSVESIDFALRRRFAWYEVEADGPRFETVMQNTLNDNPQIKVEAQQRYSRLNEAIEKTEGLGHSYQIGPTYFLKLENYVTNHSANWGDFWEYHLKLLIREYVRGRHDEKELIKTFLEAYNPKSDVTK
jgi:5-methylcytosine-specific restriction protein B